MHPYLPQAPTYSSPAPMDENSSTPPHKSLYNHPLPYAQWLSLLHLYRSLSKQRRMISTPPNFHQTSSNPPTFSLWVPQSGPASSHAGTSITKETFHRNSTSTRFPIPANSNKIRGTHSGCTFPNHINQPRHFFNFNRDIFHYTMTTEHSPSQTRINFDW